MNGHQTGRHLRTPAGAFVIQVWAESDTARGQAAGTIEHVASGAVAPFESAADLWRFLCEVMAGPGSSPPPPNSRP